MNRNEYILKLKSLKSIIDKQLLMESENDKWYNAHSSEVQKEINFCKHCKTASPKELQSHLESASKLLTEENYKVLKEIGPKVKVGSPKQADYLNKATKALKKLSEKVKNNYHLESVKMSAETGIFLIICVMLILVSIILLALFGGKLFSNIYSYIKNLLTPGRDEGDSAIDSFIKIIIASFLLGLCVVPGMIGCLGLIIVYARYDSAAYDNEHDIIGNTAYRIFHLLEEKVYYY